MSKKGNISGLGWTILVLASLLVMFFFIAKVRLFATSIVEDSECKNSIVNHANANHLTNGDVATEIKCPTKYYSFKANPDAAKIQLAESLKTCWGMWGKGEISLFSRDNTYCHVCSVINFENGEGKKINDFTQFLSSERIETGDGKGKTYAQYLKYFSTTGAPEETKQELNAVGNEQTIDLDKKYATMFIYVRGNNRIQDFLKGITVANSGTVTSGIMGGVAGGAAGYVVSLFSFIGGPIGWVVGGTAIGAGTAIYTYLNSDTDYLALTMLREYNAEELQKLGCVEAPVVQDSQRQKLG